MQLPLLAATRQEQQQRVHGVLCVAATGSSALFQHIVCKDVAIQLSRAVIFALSENFRPAFC
jgi:hypothetical protein